MFVYDTKDATKHQVTSAYFNDQVPTFDPEGKYLYYESDRTFAPVYGDFDNSGTYANPTRLAAVALRADVPAAIAPRNCVEEGKKADESKKVGFKKPGATESVGHASGRRIIQILRAKKADLDGGDYAHMRKVIGFVKRHRAQGPHDEFRVPTSRWRYSLMNWGHDPLKE